MILGKGFLMALQFNFLTARATGIYLDLSSSARIHFACFSIEFIKWLYLCKEKLKRNGLRAPASRESNAKIKEDDTNSS